MAICVKFRSLANIAYGLWNSYRRRSRCHARMHEIARDLLWIQYRRHDLKIAAAARTSRVNCMIGSVRPNGSIKRKAEGPPKFRARKWPFRRFHQISHIDISHQNILRMDGYFIFQSNPSNYLI
jgi:hypothetical protein